MDNRSNVGIISLRITLVIAAALFQFAGIASAQLTEAEQQEMTGQQLPDGRTIVGFDNNGNVQTVNTSGNFSLHSLSVDHANGDLSFTHTDGRNTSTVSMSNQHISEGRITIELTVTEHDVETGVEVTTSYVVDQRFQGTDIVVSDDHQFNLEWQQVSTRRQRVENPGWGIHSINADIAGNNDGYTSFAELDAYNVGRGHWAPQGDGSGYPGAPTGIASVRHQIIDETSLKVSWYPTGNLSNATTRNLIQLCGKGTPSNPANCKDRKRITLNGAYSKNHTFTDLNPGETYTYKIIVSNFEGSVSSRTYQLALPPKELTPLEQLEIIEMGKQYVTGDNSWARMRDPENPGRVCLVYRADVRNAVVSEPIFNFLDRVGRQLGWIYQCAYRPPTALSELHAITVGTHIRSNIRSSVLMRDPANSNHVCNVPGSDVRNVVTNANNHAVLDRVGRELGGIYSCNQTSTGQTPQQKLARIAIGKHYRSHLHSSVLMRDPSNTNRVCNVPGERVRDVETNAGNHALLASAGLELGGILRCTY